ncbi:MAG TPA: 5-(carboxyamino)imidazole ribonucleotide mutase [Syntrophobacteraceae bacterium]|nr:5-(carboxyamino)imidazole ribonucleotide mutase [Syntrophobacteraceae bacterium]
MNEKDRSASPLVGVIMGSDSDFKVMQEALEVFEDFQIPYEFRVLSAHRTPQWASGYAREAAGRGLKVIIAGAGWAAHLAGVLAGETTLPVIGVPIDSSPLQGLDALLSTVQMPPGVPVATMSIGKGGARNAALFAVQILALENPVLAEKVRHHKARMADGVLEKDRKLRERWTSRER